MTAKQIMKFFWCQAETQNRLHENWKDANAVINSYISMVQFIHVNLHFPGGVCQMLACYAGNTNTTQQEGHRVKDTWSSACLYISRLTEPVTIIKPWMCTLTKNLAAHVLYFQTDM